MPTKHKIICSIMLFFDDVEFKVIFDPGNKQ